MVYTKHMLLVAYMVTFSSIAVSQTVDSSLNASQRTPISRLGETDLDNVSANFVFESLATSSKNTQASHFCPCTTSNCGCNTRPPDCGCRTNTCDCNNCCVSTCCNPYNNRVGWFNLDVLFWSLNRQSSPPLVTRSPAGTPNAAMGIVTSAGTDVLLGGNVGDRLNTGARIQAGWWFDPSRRLGIQQEFFALSSGENATQFGGNDEILARPFFNTAPSVNAPDAQVFNIPGIAHGTTTFRDSSEIFSSATALRWGLDAYANQSQQTDATLGYRFLRFEETFSAREQLAPLGSRFIPGTEYQLNDRIQTTNTFHGVELGATHSRRAGPWTVGIRAALAVGDVQRTADSTGSTRIVVPNVSDTTVPGGFLVQPGNSGRFSDHKFTAIPQAGFNIGRALNRCWRFQAGYDFLYLNSAFRPTSVASTTFDGSGLASGSAIANGTNLGRPRTQNLILHGLNIGLTRQF